MNRIDFLESVLAQGGLYCAVGIHKSKVNQLFFSTIEEVSAWADEQVLAGVDVYFSPATYQSAISRSAKNTRMFKSIWIEKMPRDSYWGIGTQWLWQESYGTTFGAGS
jgi:hypothetical protein